MGVRTGCLSVFLKIQGAQNIGQRSRVDGDVVCEAGGILNYAYFPDGAVLSLLTVLNNGASIETANQDRIRPAARPDSADSRVQFPALSSREDLPLAPHDA